MLDSTTNDPIPVVIVEGQALYRRGLRAVVEDAGLVIRAEYASTADAIAAIGDDDVLEPGTVAACSLSLDGWQELARLMLLQSPDLPILGLVDEITAEITIEALTRGLLACMERTLPLEQWVQTIRQAHEGTLALRDMVLYIPQQVLNDILESACRKLVARHRLSAVLQKVR